MTQKKWLLVSLLSFALFLVLAFLVYAHRFLRPDYQTTQFLQNLIPHTFDVPLSLFSLFGSLEITILVTLVLGYLVYLFSKKVFWGLALFLVIAVVELAGKFFLFHPGPPPSFFRYALPFTTPHYIRTNYSFPSGHVSRTFFLTIISLFLTGIFVRNRAYRLIINCLIIIFALVMTVSRVYLGEHWFSDVLGGSALGIALGSLTVALW